MSKISSIYHKYFKSYWRGKSMDVFPEYLRYWLKYFFAYEQYIDAYMSKICSIYKKITSYWHKCEKKGKSMTALQSGLDVLAER